MAATGTPTPNIGLRIPLGTDPASVDDINFNSNRIDAKMGPVGNTDLQTQMNNANTKINSIKDVSGNDVLISRGSSAEHNITIPNSSRQLIIFTGNASVERFWMGYVYVTNSGAIRLHEIDKGSNATASIPDGTTNTLKITMDSAQTAEIRIINIYGNAAS